MSKAINRKTPAMIGTASSVPSWGEKTLGEIADVEYGYTDKSTGEGDFRYVRITDINRNGELISQDKKYIPYSKEAENFLIQDNDLLMARTGATFAKVLLYKDYEPSVFASYLIRIKFKVNVENELYWHFTKTKNYWVQANNLQSGAAQPHFNGAAVKQVMFSYPKSVELQQSLIQKFEALSAETKQLEANYQQKINDLDELKKSILQKAFAGELNTTALEV
jgi:type I restriction enzyme S subunit